MLRFLACALLFMAVATSSHAADCLYPSPKGEPAKVLYKDVGSNRCVPAGVAVDSAGVQVGTQANPTFIAGNTSIASANFTTPAGTSAYSSGQLIANSATAGSVVPLTFSACRVAGGSGMIRRVRVKTTDTGFAAANIRIALYRDNPTATNGDHAAWLTTESNYIGALDVTMDKHFSDAEKGLGAPNTGGEINYVCASGSTTIYGLVEARGAITPQGAKVLTVVLETIGN